ncbi:hypothetical protein [Urechidicola croceus]|uniref:Uncharacterized protein n=1 Tax=Urechidicola croceus TaxID=1850246 RepID=A0A1D8P405_9FLAO|nr:hypothetical protein [Urechidicola croceus]AOW19320.1 hypothetical protein LPB138_00880 [Urechidicola croceus]
MGNRANLILQKKNSNNKLILEANNQLPFFWLLMLDLNTIEKSESKFLNCFESQNKNCERNFKINKTDFEKNTKISKEYIKKFHPDLTTKFEQFSEYIKNIISDNFIELDFIEITNFYSSPTEFLYEIKKTLLSIKEMKSLDKKDLSEYLSNPNFFYLVGYDTYVNIEHKFSDFSKDYNQLQIDIANEKGNKHKEREKENKLKKKDKRKRTLYGIFISIIGLSMLIIHIIMIIHDNDMKNGRGIRGIIFGLLIMIYGFYKIKKTTTNTV